MHYLDIIEREPTRSLIMQTVYYTFIGSIFFVNVNIFCTRFVSIVMDKKILNHAEKPTVMGLTCQGRRFNPNPNCTGRLLLQSTQQFEVETQLKYTVTHTIRTNNRFCFDK